MSDVSTCYGRTCDIFSKLETYTGLLFWALRTDKLRLGIGEFSILFLIGEIQLFHGLCMCVSNCMV